MIIIANIEIGDEPKSEDVEQRVLSNILLNDKVLNEYADIIKVDMFYNDLHKTIFRAMLSLHYNNSAIGYESILNKIKYSNKNVDENSTLDYLMGLAQHYMKSFNVDSDVGILSELYQKRTIFNWMKKRVSGDMSGIASNTLVKEVEDMIENMDITSNLETEEFSTYVDKWGNDLTNIIENGLEVQKYKFGKKKLDATVLIQPSNLILIAARPSLGKSAITLDFAKNFCKQGYQTLFVCLEMSKKEIMNRLVANLAHVEADKIKRAKNLSEEDLNNIDNAKKEIKTYKLNSYTRGGLTIEHLVNLAKSLKKKDKLDILIVDYLQLLETKKNGTNRVQEVSLVSRKLKQIAMELDIPVIALSQLSRNSIDQHGKAREPQLSDLRESGSLEQDANTVLMLHSKDVSDKFQDRKFIDLFIRKNRDGMLSKVNYTYYGDYFQFIEKEWLENKKRFSKIEQEEMFREYNEDEGLYKKKKEHKEVKSKVDDLPF